MHHCRFPHEDNPLPDDIREELEAFAFAIFSGSERSQAEEFAGEADGPADPAEGSRRVQKLSIRRLLGHMFKAGSIRDFAGGNPSVAERIAHDAVEWCGVRWESFADAEELSSEHRIRSFLETWTKPVSFQSEVEWLARELPEVRAEAELARSLHPKLSHRAAHSAVRRRFTRACLAAIDRREMIRALRFIHRELPPFLEELQKKAQRLATGLQQVRDLFGSSNRLWDLSEGELMETRWDALEFVAGELEQEPSLQRLAEELGRGESSEMEEIWVREELRRTSLNLEPLGRAEIEGFRPSSRLEDVTPREFALVSDPELNLLFTRRFAEERLESYRYRDRRSTVTTHTAQRLRRVEQPRARGPLVLCVDTSGSMKGRPERVAKALALAVTRTAVAGGRSVYAISFSDRIDVVESTRPAELGAFSRFLARSFYGGTDLRPALREAMRVVKTGRYRLADVLIVSDFRVPKLFDRELHTMLSVQKELGTRFHSLTVSEKPIIDFYNLFDRAWQYDPNESAVVNL